MCEPETPSIVFCDAPLFEPKPRLLITDWQRILERHLADLLDSVNPELTILESLLAKGLTNAEADIVKGEKTREGRVSRLCYFLGVRPNMAAALVDALNEANLPNEAKAIETDLLSFDLEDTENSNPLIVVTDASRFRSALDQIAPYLEPLFEWALPQLVANHCLTAEEELQCQRSANHRTSFILQCLERRPLQHLQLFVELLRKNHCDDLLDLLSKYYTRLMRNISHSRDRGWNLPVQALHYTKRVSISEQINVVIKKMVQANACDAHWALLSGIGACGKTSAAIEAANTALDNGFDNVIWLKASDTDDQSVIGQALSALTFGLDGRAAQSLHNAQTLLNQMESAAWRRQENKKILLVLDDVWNEELPKKFTAFFNVLVTSRNEAILDNTNVVFTHIRVPMALTPEESLAMVHHILGDDRFRSLEDQEGMLDSFQDILSRLEHLPLAVNVIAAHLKRSYHRWETGGHHFLESLRSNVFTVDSNRIRMDAESLLSGSHFVGHYDYASIYAALWHSIERLDEGDREAYELFLVLPPDRLFSGEMPARVWGVSQLHADMLLDHFCTLNLLQRLHRDTFPPMRYWFRLHNFFYETLFIKRGLVKKKQHTRLVLAYHAAGLDSIPAEDLYFYRHFGEHCVEAERLDILSEALSKLSYLRARLTSLSVGAELDPLEHLCKDVERLTIDSGGPRSYPVRTMLRQIQSVNRELMPMTDLETSFIQRCLLLPVKATLHHQAKAICDRCLWLRDERPLPNVSHALCFLWLAGVQDWLVLSADDDKSWRLTLVMANKDVWVGCPISSDKSALLTSISDMKVAFATRGGHLVKEFYVQTSSWRHFELNSNVSITCLSYSNRRLLIGRQDGSVMMKEDEWTTPVTLPNGEEVLGVLSANDPCRIIAYSRRGDIVCSEPSWRVQSRDTFIILSAALSNDAMDLVFLVSRYRPPSNVSCHVRRLKDGRHMLTVNKCGFGGLCILPNPCRSTEMAIPSKSGLTILNYARDGEKYVEERLRSIGVVEASHAVWCARGRWILWSTAQGHCYCLEPDNENISLTFKGKEMVSSIHNENDQHLLVRRPDKLALFQQLWHEEVPRAGSPADLSDDDETDDF